MFNAASSWPHGVGGSNREVVLIEWKLIDNLSRHLELCQVGPGTSLVLVNDLAADPSLLSAAELAAQRSRADWASLTWSGSGVPAENRVVAGAISGADALVNLTNTPEARRAVSQLAVESETSVFEVRGTGADLRWFGAHSGLDERLASAQRLFEGAEWIELSTAADNVLDVSTIGLAAEAKSSSLSGLTTQVSWPAGTMSLLPGSGAVNGEVTLMPGDINQAAGDWIHAPVVLVIADNQLADVLGNTADTDRLLAQFESLPMATRHSFTGIQVGMHRAAPPNEHLFDPRLLSEPTANLSGGHVTLGFGDGPRHQIGGLDAALSVTLRGATLRVDDHVAVVEGGILAPDLAPGVYEQATWST